MSPAETMTRAHSSAKARSRIAKSAFMSPAETMSCSSAETMMSCRSAAWAARPAWVAAQARTEHKRARWAEPGRGPGRLSVSAARRRGGRRRRRRKRSWRAGRHRLIGSDPRSCAGVLDRARSEQERHQSRSRRAARAPVPIAFAVADGHARDTADDRQTDIDQDVDDCELALRPAHATRALLTCRIRQWHQPAEREPLPILELRAVRSRGRVHLGRVAPAEQKREHDEPPILHAGSGTAAAAKRQARLVARAGRALAPSRRNLSAPFARPERCERAAR